MREGRERPRENAADGEKQARQWKASEERKRERRRESEMAGPRKGEKNRTGKWRGVDKVRINIQSH